MNINLIKEPFIGLPRGKSILIWDNTLFKWTEDYFNVNTIFDVTVAAPIQDRQLLAYDEWNQIWKNYDAYELDDLVDSLGNHIATENLDMDGNKIVNLLSPVDYNDILTMVLFDDHIHVIGNINGLQVWITNIHNSIDGQTLNSHIDVNDSVAAADKDLLMHDGVDFKLLDRASFSVIEQDESTTDINMDNNKIYNLDLATVSTDAINIQNISNLDYDIQTYLSDQELGDHQDISISAPATYHVLEYNNTSGEWENVLLDINIANDNLGNHVAIQNLNMSGYQITSLSSPYLSDHAVEFDYFTNSVNNLTNNIVGQVLDDHDDVIISSSPTDESLLMFDGSHWIPFYVDPSAIIDNLGNHIATQDLYMDNTFKVTQLSPAQVSDDLIEFDQLNTLINDLTNQVLNDHSNVNVPSPNHDDCFSYQSGQWISAAFNFNQANDDLGSHIATQNLSMDNNQIRSVAIPINDGDIVTLGFMQDEFGDIDVVSQKLDEHVDVVYNITLQNDYILFYNTGSGLWNVTSKYDLQDDLGNHIATQNLNMSNKKIKYLKDGESDNDVVNKKQLDDHEHPWNDVSKVGSSLLDIGDVSGSLTSSYGLSGNGSSFSNKQFMSLASSEPIPMSVGYRWMPSSGTNEHHLLLCTKVGVSYGGYSNTWVNGKGELVSA